MPRAERLQTGSEGLGQDDSQAMPLSLRFSVVTQVGSKNYHRRRPLRMAAETTLRIIESSTTDDG